MKTNLCALLLISSLFLAVAQDNSADKHDEKLDETKLAPQVAGTNTVRLPDGRVVPPIKANTNNVVLTNLTMKASYAMGLQTVATLFMQDYQDEINAELMVMAIRDVFGHHKPLLPPDQIEDILKNFDQYMQIKQDQKNSRIADDNKKRGEQFLAENKKKEGVVTTKSGLQYRVITEGSGDPPEYDDKVGIHFSGKTIDGVQFSTSYKHKEPAVVPLRSQIPAWREALQMMKPGSKWELFIPSTLAYREREVGRGVGPHSTLVFELELIRVVKEGTEPQPKKRTSAEVK